MHWKEYQCMKSNCKIQVNLSRYTLHKWHIFVGKTQQVREKKEDGHLWYVAIRLKFNVFLKHGYVVWFFRSHCPCDWSHMKMTIISAEDLCLGTERFCRFPVV